MTDAVNWGAAMWLFAGPFVLGILTIDVLVMLDHWRHDRQEREERGDGG
jgi:hypothetical protein